MVRKFLAVEFQTISLTLQQTTFSLGFTFIALSGFNVVLGLID